MKELRDKFPSGKEFLALSDHQIAEAVLEIVVTRAENTDRISSKFLSIGELENIYDSVSLPAASQQQINYKLMQAYQWLLSEGYTMPAPGQPPGVVTVTSKGRLGLPPESNVENKPIIEWAGGARVTLAIVFTDIVDSTALGVELGDAAMSEVRRRHFAQSTALVAKYAGREIKTIGDSVMAVFRSAERALDYARELQLDPGSSELQMRAGINIGSVEVTADDVFGTEVTLASRVVGAIRGAEIWLSNRAKEDIDRAGTHREKGLQWQVHDGVELKGIGIERLWSLASKPSSARISTAVLVKPPSFKGVEPKEGKARFRSAEEPIGVGWRETNIFLSPGPAMWLRVMPVLTPGSTWPPHKLKDHAVGPGANFAPFHVSFVRDTTLSFLRARDGFGVYFAVGTTETSSVAFAFRTGEIWSIDTGLLASCPNDLPEPLIEKAFADQLRVHAHFLQNLGIKPPFHWIAGVAGVNGRRLEVPNRSLPGPLCLAETIIDEGTYDLEQNPAAALEPFFEEIFAECGMPRPGPG